MKILLAYPEMPSTFWTFDAAVELAGKKACYPPLGLLTVAAMLPKAWEKRLVDLNAKDLRDEDILWADFVFVGAMNVQVRSAREVIARCNALGVKVVAGGPLFTHEWETFPTVDHFVLNEAEITLPLFLADLEAGSPKRLYETKEFADVSTTPIPLWELVDMGDYIFSIVQYSRGCPYMCDFCDVTALFGRKMRVKSAAQMLAELEAMGDLSRFDMIMFADDNLIGNQIHLKKELLPALIDWRKRVPYAVSFGTQVTVNLVDDAALMRMMLDAGFGTIFCGLESPDEEALLASRKRQNTKRDLLDNVHSLQAAGFTVSAGFIVGFDADTEKSFGRMIDFIRDTGIVNATVNLLKAPPGTDLYKKMREAGRLIEPFNFDENESNIIPLMDPKALHDGFDRVLREVYAPRNVYARGAAALERYKTSYTPMRGAKRNLRASDLVTAARILWVIGIAGPDRALFWRYLARTLARHPRKLRMFVVYAVMAHHLRGMYARFDAAVATKNMERAVVDMPAPSETAALRQSA